MLNEAVARAVADYGPVDTWYENLPTGITKGDRLSGRIIKYLKVESEYPSGWSNSLVNYLGVTDNSLWRPWNTDHKTYILSNASLVTIYAHSTAFFVFLQI